MDTISGWTRRHSSFGDPPPDVARSQPAANGRPGAGDLIYRLKHWPDVPHSLRTADVLRLLSVMSSRPVRRSWVLANTRLDVQRLDRLLARLTAQDAIDTFDPAALPADRPAR